MNGLDMMKAELKELENRIVIEGAYMKREIDGFSDDFTLVGLVNLGIQIEHMKSYRNILAKRIDSVIDY